MTDPIGTAQERELIERLENEEMRLAGQSIDRGCVDSGLSATLAREAADALESRIAEGEAMREALELFTGQAVFDPHTHRASVDEFVVSKARAALSLHRRPT
jgi:hypothetical protein